MRLIEKAKRFFKNRKQKRVAKNPRVPSANMTIAEELIMSNWGLSFSFKEPERKGVKLAAKRLKEKLKANASIPDPKGVTRQMARARERKEFKRFRSQLKETQRKKVPHRNEKPRELRTLVS